MTVDDDCIVMMMFCLVLFCSVSWLAFGKKTVSDMKGNFQMARVIQSF